MATFRRPQPVCADRSISGLRGNAGPAALDRAKLRYQLSGGGAAPVPRGFRGIPRPLRASEIAVDTAAEWLEPGTRWNPLIDAVSTYVSGAELSRLSVHDTESYLDTDLNWRMRRGYGALIATLARAAAWRCR